MGRKGKDKSSPSGRLRIVAGKWRGRLLPVADLTDLRPTPERVRETLFNWLVPEIEGKFCLDLFAGTGALGIEALSRGARQVYFVENSSAAAALLRDNSARLDAAGAIIHEDDAIMFLKTHRNPKFDVVFLDPPFADDRLGELCRLLEGSDILAPGCRIYLEQDGASQLPKQPAGWSVLKEKTAGQVRYALVTNKHKSNSEE